MIEQKELMHQEKNIEDLDKIKEMKEVLNLKLDDMKID